MADAAFSDVSGTDTPPAKNGRSLFPEGDPAAGDADRRTAQPFSSIMHKFTREKGSESFDGRIRDENRSSSQPKPVKVENGCIQAKGETVSHDCSDTYSSKFDDNGNEGIHPQFDLTSDIMGPETPANRRLVPRLKRVQDYPSDSDVTHSSLGSSKRPKSIKDFGVKEEIQHALHVREPSKFEWLNPSSIRDANGRRPTDLLYDKRTLYIPPDVLCKMSASQKQYWNVKCQYMDIILFFKVGKFYELYELDAEIGQKELDWKMTISGVGKCRQVGISESGIDAASQKLVARGYKVGRIEQLETSDQAKARGSNSLIQRKLVHVSTPSTISDSTIGEDSVHLLALKEKILDLEKGCTVYGFAFVDCAALKFWIGSVCDDDSFAALGALLMQVSPREVIYGSSGISKGTQKALSKYGSSGSFTMQLTPMAPGDVFDVSKVKKLINSKEYFKGSLDSWTSVLDSTMDHDLVICALGGLIDHLCRLKIDDAICNGELLPYHVYSTFLKMDGQTLVNLELFCNNYDGGLSGTLYNHLNHCITPCGKRLLRRWICNPLRNIDEINDRLDIVEGLINHSGVISIIVQYLRRLPDLERLLGRVKATIGSSSTTLLPLVGDRVVKQRIKSYGSLIKGLQIGIDLLINILKEDYRLLAFSKVVNLPMLSGLAEVINQFEIAINDDFPQYLDHNVKDSDADALSVLVELFSRRATDWSLVIQVLSVIDVLQSFSATVNSSCGSMSRPIFLPVNSHSNISSHESRGPVIQVKGLWHPYAVGENGSGLVPNDIYLGEDSKGHHPCALLLTGPNMGGKSTLLRSTCLAVIMAQLGCYVPSEMCLLSPADAIFTRLGAIDRIMSGESTFFVECAETATLLRNSTKDSLVLLDELGRGTSTFDGYAIAHAVFRHLVEMVCCRLLFATHYHPLTEEFASHPHVILKHMACAFKPRLGSSLNRDRDLIFLYQLASGACPESYGLQVALMAGIPKPVVEAATKASERMKLTISENFRSSVGRSEFSTLHEEWLKTLLAVSKLRDISCDEDTSDTLFCLWHELKSSYRSGECRE